MPRYRGFKDLEARAEVLATKINANLNALRQKKTSER